MITKENFLLRCLEQYHDRKHFARLCLDSSEAVVFSQVVRNSAIVVEYPFLWKCRSGASLVYNRLPWQEPDVPCRIDILHEDDHLVRI